MDFHFSRGTDERFFVMDGPTCAMRPAARLCGVAVAELADEVTSIGDVVPIELRQDSPPNHIAIQLLSTDCSVHGLFATVDLLAYVPELRAFCLYYLAIAPLRKYQ